MPKFNSRSDIDNDVYEEMKNLRGSHSSKRLRRLKAFERAHYKKTCEVKKTGHGLEPDHHLNDGGLLYSTRNLTYSLNKKKRWLLPEIIEQRICEYDPKEEKPVSKKGDQFNLIDERLKIVMYENENTRHRSTCLRYANSQTEPHVIHKNGRRFNSETLTRWMDFDTNRRWSRTRRNNDADRVNQPNFGFEQRPGFFPSEVTYEFLFPKQLPASESHRNGRISLTYCSALDDNYYDHGRYYKDTTKNRRKTRKYECLHYEDYEDDEEDLDANEYFISPFDILDEDQSSCSNEFPIDYFIPIPSSNCRFSHSDDDDYTTEIIDRKAKKYYEPPASSSSDATSSKSSIINEKSLCSIPCKNESDFLSTMQQSNMYISQANLSPPVFMQCTSTASFVVIYTYSRSTHQIEVIVKYADQFPILSIQQNKITCSKLIQLVHTKLSEDQTNQENPKANNYRLDVDDLRGSLPVPLAMSKQMLLVKPHSTDKQSALEKEKLIQRDDQIDENQWFDTTKNLSETFECSVCCETLSLNDVHQLLSCHHTICHSCLTSYIRASIASATYSSSSISPLTCFQPNCSTQLNSTLLQAFISYDIYHSYIDSLLERQLFSTGRYRKCPSRACSNLLIIENQTKPSLMCSCGQRVCTYCLEEYHFPASCQQYKSYEKRLRQSSDHLLSITSTGDTPNCYIAEGKNCPTCGEFVEKNGGCPHMTCKCGYEYCWFCLKRWATHNSATCFVIPESTHELRSATRSRFFNKAINHRRQRNQKEFDTIGSLIQTSKLASSYNIILSTYIDLNTLAEFIYVLMQKRRLHINIRSVLGQTAHRLEADAFNIRIRLESNQLKEDHVNQIRLRLQRTALNLLHMKKNKVLL